MTSVKIENESRYRARTARLTRGDVQLLTPTYFPAVSGTSGLFRPEQLIDLVVSFSYPRILVSCHDISRMHSTTRKKVIKKIGGLRSKGSFVFLDSGVFEAFWKEDKHWNFDSYRESLLEVESDVFTSFDVLPRSAKPDKKHAKHTVEMIRRSCSIDPARCCAPIVHGANPRQLLSVLQAVLKSTTDGYPIIAVAERDCGILLSERAQTIASIRECINGYDGRTLLHVLGCGDPISMALYTYFGADSFDSLDWTECAVQRDNLRMRSIFHFELIKCSCRVCAMKFVNPITRPLLHNLLFYQDFVANVREMVRRDTLHDFLIEYIGKGMLKKPVQKK